MEECERLDSERTELTEFQCEASDVISQEDEEEDEVEELQNRCLTHPTGPNTNMTILSIKFVKNLVTFISALCSFAISLLLKIQWLESVMRVA